MLMLRIRMVHSIQIDSIHWEPVPAYNMHLLFRVSMWSQKYLKAKISFDPSWSIGRSAAASISFVPKVKKEVEKKYTDIFYLIHIIMIW